MTHTRRDFALMAAGVAASTPSFAQTPKIEAPKGPWTEEGAVQRGGTRIHYVGMGSGPPLILLHKLGGWVADWRHVAPALAQKYRVIAMDMPGHGDSTINGPTPFLQTLGENAAVIMAALDELKIDKFDVVGNSHGGCTAVVMAALWPERVKHLVLLSVALGGVTSREALEKVVDPPGYYDANGVPQTRPFEEIQKSFGVESRSVYEEQNASRAKGGAWVRASLRGVGNGGVANYLPRITAPTLLIYGERGTYHSYEKVGKEKLKRVRSVFIPNTGSFTHQENPRETEKVLLSFLAEPT